MTDAPSDFWHKLEQGRLEAQAQAVADTSVSPPEQPVSRRELSARPPSPVPVATEGRKVIREILLNGTVVETNVTPPPRQASSGDDGYRPFSRRSPLRGPVRTLKRGTGRPL